MAAGKGRVTTDMGYKTGAIVTTAIAAAFVVLSSVCISIEFLGHTPTAVAIGLLTASLPVGYIAWRVRLDVGEIKRAEERNRLTAMGNAFLEGMFDSK